MSETSTPKGLTEEQDAVTSRRFQEDAQDLARRLIPIEDALKECQYAIEQALRTGQVGWLQEAAKDAAVKALRIK